MPRPTIDRLLDHTVRIRRPRETKDGLGAIKNTYDLIADLGAALNHASSPATDTGGSGLAPAGRLRLYLRPDANVNQRDIVEVTAGPTYIGTRWEIDELPSRPKNHHTQIDCISWNGVLTMTGES